MSRTVKLPDELAERVAAEADRQGISPDELAARVLAEHVPARRRLSFAAIGESDSGSIAAEAEDMLAEGCRC